jgi:tetratricopeptide (TPR) repeat protein
MSRQQCRQQTLIVTNTHDAAEYDRIQLCTPGPRCQQKGQRSCCIDAMFGACRSAARAKQEQWAGALDDATKCVHLKQGWAKGWVRLGNAHCGLQQWSEARDAYARAIELEPDDKAIQQSFAKVCSHNC